MKTIFLFHSRTFSHMKNLTKLDLSDNKLKSFDPNILPDSIKYINILSNELTSFANFEKPFDNMETLILSHNDLSSFALNLNNLPNLERLDISRNYLTQMQIADHSNHKLTRIDLHSNYLEPIMWQWAICHLNQTKVFLEENSPICDCDTFDVINDLKKYRSYGKDVANITTCRTVLPKLFILIERYPCPITQKDWIEYKEVNLF